MTVFEKVKEIILNNLSKVEESQITMEANLKEDLGADSIDAVEIIMDLEDAFNISIDTDNAESVSTVGNIVEAIEATINKK